jgi:hypothetical protein
MESMKQGISGCIRVCGDPEFLRETVESHLPYLDEIVLVHQPSGDPDLCLQVCEGLEKQHPNVRLVRYPVKPYFIDTPEFKTTPDDDPKSFVYLSNWALKQCEYSWIAKIEADVIALNTFKNITDRIRTHFDDKIYYGRLILNLAGHKDKISLENPRNGGLDEAVFPNDPRMQFYKAEKWECLDNVFIPIVLGFSAYHMKRCKAQYAEGWNGETYIPFTKENVQRALLVFNQKNLYPGLDDPLGSDSLYAEENIRWLK